MLECGPGGMLAQHIRRQHQHGSRASLRQIFRRIESKRGVVDRPIGIPRIQHVHGVAVQVPGRRQINPAPGLRRDPMPGEE